MGVGTPQHSTVLRQALNTAYTGMLQSSPVR